MHKGEIQQWAPGYQLYHEPANRFVADFIGEGILMPGIVASADSIRVSFGTVPAHVPPGCSEGDAVEVLIRPDDILHDDASTLQARVLAKAFRGAEFLYTLALPGGAQVLSLVPSHHNHAIGEQIGIRLEIDHVIAFRGEGG